MMENSTILIIAIILAAILLDVWLLRSAHRFNKNFVPTGEGVYLFGRHWPLLTWIQSLLHKKPSGLQASSITTALEPALPVEVPPDARAGTAPADPVAAGAGEGVQPALAAETGDPPLEMETGLAKTRRRWVLLECGLIFFAVFLYCWAILDFGKPTQLPGNESGIFQALDWTLVKSLQTYRQFPLWNPYLSSGLPYVADPMLHVFNPVSTIPVLLFGVQDGFKLGIFLSFLLGAFGMWRLGSILGMGPPARLWVALMYAFAGQPVARFFQGQYLFVLAFAWIPWALGSLILLARTGRRVYWAATVFSLAMLFFSGNVYYQFYMLILIGFFTLVYVTGFRRGRPFISIDRKLLVALILTGSLALGLIAIQLLPLAEFWPRLSKSLEVAGSHTPQQIYLDFTSKDTFRPDAFVPLPAREEYYAYIGQIPILALLLIPLAWRKRERKPILVLVLMLVFAILWIDLDQMPWYTAFLETKVFLQFRHLLRILIYAGFAIFLLAGLGFDTAWKLLEAQTRKISSGFRGILRTYAANLCLVILGALMLVSVGDLYQTNRKHIQTEGAILGGYEALSWLRQYDLSDYAIRFNPNNTLVDGVISEGLRFMEVWYHFGDIRGFTGQVNSRQVEARPQYIVQPSGDVAPDSPGVTLIRQVGGYNIYHLPANLPYAFSVTDQVLDADTTLLTGPEVVQETSFTQGPNQVEVIANAQVGSTLVVLTTHYPGWELRVDDRPQKLLNVGGYLGATLQPGVHKYTFSFRPRSFYIGLVISLLSLALVLGVFVMDTRPVWRAVFAGLRAAPQRSLDFLLRAREKVFADRLVATAVYRQGSLHPETPLAVEEEASLRLTLEPVAGQASPLGSALRRWAWASFDLTSALLKTITLAGVLTVSASAIYAFTRFYALERFPIYYFGDEAVQSLFAEDLLSRHFHSPDGTFLPIYVEAAGNRWTPLLSMYFHALAQTLFGKSILVSRGTSALISLLGAAAVGWALHKVFKARLAWVGILLVAVTPAWFLHSRTAFETVMTTAFYACFLLFYLLYRTQSPRYIYAAVVFGAATFYSYSNAQAIILAAAGLLFFSDLRYHWQNRGVVLKALVLAVIFAIPFFEFRVARPQAIAEHLRTVGSYWYMDTPFSQKVFTFLQKYLYGLSPQYWFFPNSQDLPRHRMLGFGQMQTLALPLVLVGLAVCIANWRSSPHRAVILAALATPVGAALVDVGIARVLTFIIPANLLAAIGLEWILERWKSRLPFRATAWLIFGVLAWANLALLRTSLEDGPLWFRDYGLYGMQYGARQLFEEAIPEYLRNEPDTTVLVTSTWANGADNFLRFFYTPEEQKRVVMDGVESYMFKKRPLDQSMLFVMSAAEYESAKSSPKFESVKVEKIIPYPDGTPGFYFARLKYVPNIDAVFTAEEQVRRQLLSGTWIVDGQEVEIRYSKIDMGDPALMFDNDLYTLARGLEANPFILEMTFSEPRTISGMDADFGLVNVTVTVQLFTQYNEQPVTYNETFLNSTGSSAVEMSFENPPERVNRVRIEILNILSGETANIHIRELHFVP